MKKSILLITLLSAVLNTFCQENPAPSTTKEFYLQKSRNKRTTAWILLGGGTAAIVGGTIGFASTFRLFSSDDSASEGYAILSLAGVVADVVSIPFFISAGHNKRLAAEVSMGSLPVTLPRQNSVACGEIPALKVRLSF